MWKDSYWALVSVWTTIILSVCSSTSLPVRIKHLVSLTQRESVGLTSSSIRGDFPARAGAGAVLHGFIRPKLTTMSPHALLPDCLRTWADATACVVSPCTPRTKSYIQYIYSGSSAVRGFDRQIIDAPANKTTNEWIRKEGSRNTLTSPFLLHGSLPSTRFQLTHSPLFSAAVCCKFQYL